MSVAVSISAIGVAFALPVQAMAAPATPQRSSILRLVVRGLMAILYGCSLAVMKPNDMAILAKSGPQEKVIQLQVVVSIRNVTFCIGVENPDTLL